MTTMHEAMTTATGATRAERRRNARAMVKGRSDPVYPVSSLAPASLLNRAKRWDGKPRVTFLTN